MSESRSASLTMDFKAAFQELGLARPMRPQPYEPGDEIVYDVKALEGAAQARVRVQIDKFVGGGFAGQVYRVKLLAFESGSVPGLNPGQLYAMKILIPPSAFSKLFRDLIFFLGFQAAFQLQVNPAASRSGALWQKFIRRAAGIRMGGEQAVVDIHATFIDETLGSCGELSEWVEGRTWRLEVDDRLDLLRRWSRRGKVEPDLGSPEFRAKKVFMKTFVALLHEVGAHEFARQYEWSTCKSQPNCLKRASSEGDPSKGLVAVDFRAGLALLPFLPMSPGDFKLILTGLLRGSLVQFDRGDLEKLDSFIAAHGEAFEDMRGMLEELKTAEAEYRDSTPDITHHHVRLLFSGKLWSTIRRTAARGWRIRGLVEARQQPAFERSTLKASIFVALGFVPVVGRMLRKAWGRADWRRHYAGLLSSPSYFRKAVKGWAIERAGEWYRAGRVDEARARKVAASVWTLLAHLPLSILPPGLHRFLSDWTWFKEKLSNILVRPVKLYFNAPLREQWLRDMVQEGRRKHILNEQDAAVIGSQIPEPYIQKYLKSLVVHMCLMPTTHIVNAIVVIYFLSTHEGLSKAEAAGYAALITAVFQVTPISPGSLARGLYVLYLMIRERNFKEYNLAVFLSFFKYIGYLAFPIQMTYRYPVLARFMAGHWATEAVHVVPVFGEGGALMERKTFDLFYNWPLTLRRRMARRTELRATQKPRSFHFLLCAGGLAAVFCALDAFMLHSHGVLPSLREIWWAAVFLPFAGGALFTLGAGGMSFNRRIVLGALCGTTIGLLSTLFSLPLEPSADLVFKAIALKVFWRVFVFTIMATLGALIMELTLPEPGPGKG